MPKGRDDYDEAQRWRQRGSTMMARCSTTAAATRAENGFVRFKDNMRN
ncbi:unnamed protein product [Linum tenue]|uniref:Uncharacterized protein n=1 Tax=Linum tenue TaxID=586396 RepID=A0AAV0LLW3_9ROSI|nr:unnamed protein product [Linum tenue]